MGEPTVPYALMADGYKITSGENGFRATASFLTLWENAFVFHDDVMGFPSAAVVGPVSYATPWRFPGAPAARMYASSCEIEPVGVDGGPLPPTLGLAPGEFWTHARINVTWDTPPYAQSAGDDPGNLQQFDPANPITYCEMSIDSGGQMETRSKGGYEFADGDLTKVRSDLAVFVPESRLVLNFPKIPFLPWQRVQTYLGSLNDRVLFQCAVGTLLFESARTKFAATSQGLMGQSFEMTMAYRGYHWNMVPHPTTGVNTLVRKKGATSESLYAIKDWRELFY